MRTSVFYSKKCVVTSTNNATMSHKLLAKMISPVGERIKSISDVRKILQTLQGCYSIAAGAYH